jgi:hypothetical protein
MGDTEGKPVRFLFLILTAYSADEEISFRIPFVLNPTSQTSLTIKYKLVKYDSTVNLGIPVVLAEYSFTNHKETIIDSS